MSRSVLRVVLIILAIAVLLGGAIGGFCWWKMAKLKEDLVQGLETAIGAQVQIGSLELDLWRGELRAAGITLTNDRPSAPWQKGAISQATIRFNFVDAFKSKLPLTVDVSSWTLVLTPSSKSSSADSPAPRPNDRIQVTKLSAHGGTVEIDFPDGRQITLEGVAFEANGNTAGIWTTVLQASSLKAGSLEAGASSVQIRSDQDKATFSSLRMACGTGLITGEGDISLSSTHDIHATLKASKVPVTMLVGVAWQMKLSGQVNGDLVYQGNDQTGSAKGKIALDHAKFNLVPGLGKMTALVGLPDITDLEVDKATATYEWKEGQLNLTDIDVRKNDIARTSGTASIDATGMVDARLKLGLPSTITAKWPQLQEKVFSVASEDYNWTDVHLTGPPDHLQEDLSPRVLAVGMQGGGNLLDDAKQKAAELWKSFMGK